MIRKSIGPLLALSPLLVVSPAAALQATANLSVQLTITAPCTVVSAPTLNFGTQGVLTGNVDQTSTLQVQCTNSTPYDIGLSAGAGTGATVAARKLTSGANTISYSLFQDAARSTVWGNTVSSDTVGGTGNGAAQSLTIYGRVPAQTTPAPATYTDTIAVTIFY